MTIVSYCLQTIVFFHFFDELAFNISLRFPVSVEEIQTDES